MSSSEANLVPVNNSVATEDVCNKNDEIADTNDEIPIPDKTNINNNDIFKKSVQNRLEEVIREKKEKFYEFKNSVTKISEPIATNNNEKTQEISRRHSCHYRGLDFKWYHIGEIEQERTCC